MDDMINKQVEIDTMIDWLRNRIEDEKNGEPLTDRLKHLPSAQPDIKQAAKLLSDFIESCPGGDSYLITPDGEELRTDWGYTMEGIQLIHDWAERREE